MNRKKALFIEKAHNNSKRKVVLIVHCDEINVRVFSKIISRYGGGNIFSVRASENTEEILLLAASGKIDVILMGTALANSIYQGKPTDGLTITRLLKSDPKTASIPVLLTCAYGMKGDRESFLALSGADAYISLPITDRQAFVGIVAKYGFSDPEDSE